MNFKKLTLRDIPVVRSFFHDSQARTCDFTVGGMFMWRDFFRMEYTVENNAFYSRLYDNNNEVYYNLPLSDNIESALDYFFRQAPAGQTVRFCTIPAMYIPLFAKHGRSVLVSEQEIFADYLYNADDFVHLPGKKYSGQRNQISQFVRDVGSWSFERLDADSLDKVLAFFRDSYLQPDADGGYELEENNKVIEVLNNFDTYAMKGGYLTADNTVVGFTVNETVGDTLFVHIEKVSRLYKGAYQMLANQAAIAFAGENVKYINREEDMGDAGLMTSKRSYHPVKLLRKYHVLVSGY